MDYFIQASSIGGTKHSVSTDYYMKILGLDVCADTIVGNDMLRGISGGQRKRVTTGLFLVPPLLLYPRNFVSLLKFKVTWTFGRFLFFSPIAQFILS